MEAFLNMIKQYLIVSRLNAITKQNIWKNIYCVHTANIALSKNFIKSLSVL